MRSRCLGLESVVLRSCCCSSGRAEGRSGEDKALHDCQGHGDSSSREELREGHCQAYMSWGPSFQFMLVHISRSTTKTVSNEMELDIKVDEIYERSKS